MNMPEMGIIAPLVALQFVSFGWRLNREITVGDGQRRTWLPLPDVLNLMALLAVVLFCVVMPMAGNTHPRLVRTTLSIGYTLIAFHPFNEAAHYRLFSKHGRRKHLEGTNGDYPWITDHEILTVTLSVIFASIAGCFVWRA